MPHRAHAEGYAVLNSCFAHELPYVGLYCSHFDAKGIGNVFVAAASGEQVQYLFFTAGEYWPTERG